MTDSEINEAVARKLGVKPRDVDFDSWPPDYCHSIEAAWEIIEWAIHNHKSLNLNLTSTMKPMWMAGFLSRGDVQADTAPMAICLAFLKIPMENSEK